MAYTLRTSTIYTPDQVSIMCIPTIHLYSRRCSCTWAFWTDGHPRSRSSQCSGNHSCTHSYPWPPVSGYCRSRCACVKDRDVKFEATVYECRGLNKELIFSLCLRVHFRIFITLFCVNNCFVFLFIAGVRINSFNV